MRTHFLPAGEKKQVITDLENQFGIKKIPGMLIEAGREKTRLFTGNLTREQLIELDKICRIELIGLYAVKKEDTYRISLDSIYLFENQITKNVIEITEEQANDWMRGKDLNIETQSGVVVIKFNDYFLGCGKSNGKVIFNYVPKNRRINR